jgi:hypothetical protein
VFISTSWVAIATLWDTTNPEVSISELTLSDPPRMDLYEKGMGLAFGAFIPPSIVPPSEMARYITIIGLIMRLDLADIETGTYNPVVLKIVPFKKCSEIEDLNFAQHY